MALQFQKSGDEENIELREIPGFSGMYLAGTDGGIYSRYYNRWGTTAEPRRLRPALNKKNGYLYVALRTLSGPKTQPVHRLVLSAFCGIPSSGQDTRHLDGDKTNNKPSNLSSGTRKENMADTVRMGRSLRGARHPFVKLNDQAVRVLRFFRWKKRTKLLAGIYKVSASHVRSIQRGADWVWLGEPWESN